MRIADFVMMRQFIKPYLPRSLFGRASLILILPIILLQMVVGVVFIQRHFEDVTAQMTRSIIRELDLAIGIVATMPEEAEAQVALDALALPLGFDLSLIEGAQIEGENQRRFYDLSGRILIRTFHDLIDAPTLVDLVANPRLVDLRIQTARGVLAATIPRGRVTASNPHQLLVLMIVTSLFLILIAVVFLRNQVRPILALADAAEDFGKGRSTPFHPSGADEVRRAGQVFLSMRTRLERQIEQRTQMLSGVSHDLRTPLTRMKLTIALAGDTPEAAELERDVDEMEQMLDAFLAFARGDHLEEVAPTDPVELAEAALEQARRMGISISFSCVNETPEDRFVQMRPGAVARALQNLINNAGHYGTRVRLSLRLLARTCEFVVEDNGPGIPAADRELVLRPFARLDTSRNQNEGGGVGLGLSITLDIARSHGGTLVLDDSAELGGLRACLRLPR